MNIKVQNYRGLDDIQREMDQLASNFRKVYTVINRNGEVVGEKVSWISADAEARHNELQERCAELERVK